MSTKAIVLSSGGVDSTTCLGVAIDTVGKENVVSLSFLYGQKHDKELECAQKIADYYEIAHSVIDLTKTGIMDNSNCSLLQQSTEEIKHKSYAEQIAEDGEGMVSTYVPFRNGLFLASAAAYAMATFPEDEVYIYLGAHADDAAGEAYADCSPKFANAMEEAISVGTYGKVHVSRPFIDKNKAGVISVGLKLGVPYELTWSCYEGGDKPCGTCGTCIDRAAAFAANGVEDPALR